MSRISIDVTPEQHQRLKALAALQGKSIKEFVLSSTLGSPGGGGEDEALAELETMIDSRLARAKQDGWSTRSVKDVFGEAIEGAKGSPGE